MLIVEKLTKTYSTPQGPLTVLREVDLSLQAGETVTLTGESGSGKSTLLHLIAGLDAPDSGEIRLNGERLPRRELVVDGEPGRAGDLADRQ